MKILRITISFLILSVLGLSLAAEAFSSSHHASFCEVSGSEKTLSNVHGSDFGESHKPGEACSDPCHVGNGHFGHGSFVFFRENFALNSEVLTSFFSSHALSFTSVAVAGLHRPPKLA